MHWHSKGLRSGGEAYLTPGEKEPPVVTQSYKDTRSKGDERLS